MAKPELPQASVRIAGKKYAPGADHGVAALLTAAGWVLQRLPSQVGDADQRAELVRALAQARNLMVEITCTPSTGVRVRDGQRVLVEISTNNDGRRTRRAASAERLS